MEKSRVLVAGLGQCGGILANAMKQYNQRYTSIFINSSIGDSRNLENANKDTRFTFSGADGSGSDRSKGEGYIVRDKMRLVSFLKNYLDFDYMVVFWGTSGGTGSGVVKEFVDTVHKLAPRMVINLVGVLPSLDEDSLRLRNAIACCGDISDISNIVNDIKFINNTRGKNYTDINLKAITDIDMEYGMIGHSSVGSIDANNLNNVVSAKGYGVILNLQDGFNNIGDAITHAEEHSVFAIPNNLDCSYGAVNFKENRYNVDDVQELIISDETIYKTHNKNKYNLIALGGCEMPYNEIEDIEVELKERDIKKPNRKRNTTFNFKSKISSTQNENALEQRQEISAAYVDDDDLDALFNPENYRF